MHMMEYFSSEKECSADTDTCCIHIGILKTYAN